MHKSQTKEKKTDEAEVANTDTDLSGSHRVTPAAQTQDNNSYQNEYNYNSAYNRFSDPGLNNDAYKVDHHSIKDLKSE